MGVIRWKEQYPGRWYGYLGRHGIVDVIDFGTVAVWTLPDTLRLPDGDGEEFLGGNRAVSVEAAKAAIEDFVGKWMADADLVPRSDYDDIHERYRKLNISLGDRYLEIRDLADENAVLKERIGSAFGNIDDAITALKRKVDDIVADTGVDRSYSWDVPVDEWWKVKAGDAA